MFKDRTLTIPDHEYRDIQAFSYSILKAIDEEGPQALVSGRTISGKALEFGSLVDILLTSPERKNDVFWTKTLTKPTASLLILADSILNTLTIENKGVSDLTDGVINAHITNLGLWPNTKKESSLKEKYDVDIFWTYLAESIASQGKTIISQETLEAAEHCATVLLTHDFTRDYFIEREGVEILKQPSIVYKFRGTTGKARIDLLVVDHNTKTIHVFDIKTGASLPSKFEESFYHFKYYLQAVSYLLAVQSVVVNNPEFADYKIDTFKFLYISKKLPDVPVIWEVPEDMLNHFSNGWRSSTGGYITGFLELVDDYKCYTESQLFNTERKVMEKRGNLKITLS